MSGKTGRPVPGDDKPLDEASSVPDKVSSVAQAPTTSAVGADMADNLELLLGEVFTATSGGDLLRVVSGAGA